MADGSQVDQADGTALTEAADQRVPLAPSTVGSCVEKDARLWASFRLLLESRRTAVQEAIRQSLDALSLAASGQPQGSEEHKDRYIFWETQPVAQFEDKASEVWLKPADF